MCVKPSFRITVSPLFSFTPRLPGTFVGNAESTSPPPVPTSPAAMVAAVTGPSVPTIPVVPTVVGAPNSAPAVEALNPDDVKPPASGTRKARVLYDYEAADSSELSLLSDEVGGVTNGVASIKSIYLR